MMMMMMMMMMMLMLMMMIIIIIHDCSWSSTPVVSLKKKSFQARQLPFSNYSAAQPPPLRTNLTFTDEDLDLGEVANLLTWETPEANGFGQFRNGWAPGGEVIPVLGWWWLVLVGEIYVDERDGDWRSFAKGNPFWGLMKPSHPVHQSSINPPYTTEKLT